MQLFLKHTAAWLTVIPCLIVKGFPLVDDGATSLRSRSPADVQPSEVIQVAPSAGGRLLGATALGTQRWTWPGNSEQPGDYQLFITKYDTRSSATLFRGVQLTFEILDGPGICDNTAVQNWWKVGGGWWSRIDYKAVKDQVSSSDVAAALATARSEAQTTITQVQQSYNEMYPSPQSIDRDWSTQLQGAWVVQATPDQHTEDFAFNIRYLGWSTNAPSEPPTNARAFAVAALIIVRAMIELISRKLDESTAQITLLDFLYVKIAIKVTRNLFGEGLDTMDAYKNQPVPERFEVENAIRDIGLSVTGLAWLSRKRFLGEHAYHDLLLKKELVPCHTDHSTS